MCVEILRLEPEYLVHALDGRILLPEPREHNGEIEMGLDERRIQFGGPAEETRSFLQVSLFPEIGTLPEEQPRLGFSADLNRWVFRRGGRRLGRPRDPPDGRHAEQDRADGRCGATKAQAPA